MFKNIFQLYSKAEKTLFPLTRVPNTILQVALKSELQLEGYKELEIKPVSTKTELSPKTVKAIQNYMFKDGSKSWKKHVFAVKTALEDDSSFTGKKSIEHHVMIVDDHIQMNSDKFSISKYFFYNRNMPHEYDSERFEFLNAQNLIKTFRFRIFVIKRIPKFTAESIFNSREIKSMFANLNQNYYLTKAEIAQIKETILSENDQNYSEITRGIYLCNNHFLKKWFLSHNISKTPMNYQYKILDASQALQFGNYTKLTPMIEQGTVLDNNYVDYGNSILNAPLSYLTNSWLNDEYLIRLTKVIGFYAFQIKLTKSQICKLFILDDNKKKEERTKNINRSAKTITKSTKQYDLINRLDTDSLVSKSSLHEHSSKSTTKAHAEQLSLF
ncbi:hypothetical protein ABVC46_02190 [Lactobacillus crispatus]|jgi:hypothetical protein|uniref:Uncharacterized protein n=1 Tax=Lactobacillus crispatus TaxID=47770 RepID=A0AAW8WM24_9LACO|nr:hypothetical protein [Lactobacillus crispatus]MCT7696652.1 hypothetical protein [Lactobacillus crispatus]MCT7708116.1 hypothetical protein [Lactobacillus crispatus]MCT7730825.1 hypothetical protein [Lactobacillus crispatus]MCT7807613.1 hypothetical protein [Lactobacillus crispatus]MCT7815742.1 hypothetical protein [Lactobacillus crispatus]